jgi:hypothetical protein
MLVLSQETEKEQALHNLKPMSSKISEAVSLSDIVKFFILHGKFIGLVTAILSPFAIWLCLQVPRPYQKQLTLSVKLNFFPVVQSSSPSQITQMGIVQSFLYSNPNQVHAFAFDALPQLKLAQTTITPTYTNDSQKIDVLLQSPSAEALNSASSQIVSQLLKKFQTPVREILAVNLQATETDIQKNKQVLAQLKNQVAREQGSSAKQLALETELAQQFSSLAALEFDKNYLQQKEQQLLDFTAKLISIKVVSASATEVTRSPRQLIAIAIAISFLVAVAATIYRQLLRDKAMSNQKPAKSQDV